MARPTVHSGGHRVAAVLQLQSAAPESKVGLVQGSAGEDRVCYKHLMQSPLSGGSETSLSPLPHFSLHRQISEC